MLLEDYASEYVNLIGEAASVKEALELCDEIIEIPQQGTKHSLNVSVCGGIISWELYKHLRVK